MRSERFEYLGYKPHDHKCEACGERKVFGAEQLLIIYGG